jgi:hypothetical protein
MGEVPSPPSQLIDLSRQTVSVKVDTEGGELGWEYAGMTKDSDGADFYVWKRPLDR